MWVFWTLRDALCVAGSGSGRGPCESGRAAAPARGWAAGRPSLRPQRSRSHGARGGSAWCPRPHTGPAHCAPTPALRTVSARARHLPRPPPGLGPSPRIPRPFPEPRACFRRQLGTRRPFSQSSAARRGRAVHLQLPPAKSPFTLTAPVPGATESPCPKV